MATYETGGYNGNYDHSFASYYSKHKKDVSDELVRRYGSQYIVGMLEFMDAKKSAHNQRYSHFEQRRIHRKLYATCTGDVSGNPVTFTVDSSSQITIPKSAAPYDGTLSDTVANARVGDMLLIKPASGTVSWGNYTHALVVSVNDTAGTFVARSMTGTAIPTLSSATEIIITGNAHGEGSAQPAGVRHGVDEYFNNMQIVKETVENTSTEKWQRYWYDEVMPNGMKTKRYFLKGEGEAYVNFMNNCELAMLTAVNIDNDNLADVYTANPIATTSGLLNEVKTKGVDRTYTGLNGLTIADMKDHAIEQDKEKAGMDHLMFNGISLDMQLDDELADTFKNGAFVYGGVKFDEDKKVAFNFTTFKLSSYVYNKRVLPAFNDLQSLGADGYGFPYEGFTVPTKKAKIAGGEERGAMVPTLRLRYLEANGKDSSMRVSHFDGFTQSKEGDDIEQIRYISQKGFELFAGNTTSYISKA